MAQRGLASGWPIARIFGITVRLHASWLIIFFLLVYSLAVEVLPMFNLAGGEPWWRGAAAMRQIEVYRGMHPEANFQQAAQAYGYTPWPETDFWILAVIGTLGLFVCVLAHEISHSVVARAAGIPVEGITLFVFGGVSQLKKEAENPGDEFRIAAAGPAMSLAIGLVCGILYYGLGSFFLEETRSLLFYFTFINVALAVFNVLPGFPLDGGRILRALLWTHYGDYARATRVAAWWGGAIGAVFIMIGLLELWVEFTMLHTLSLGPLWLVLIGLFLRHAAKAGYQQLAMKDAFADLTVRDVIQPAVVTVEPDLTLERVVDDYFYHYRYRSFPVLEADRLAGVISLKDVQAVPRAEWPVRRVRDAMHQIREENLVHPADDLADVFRKMAEEDKGHLPVVEEGRLVGIVTRHDIMTLIQLRTDLGGRSGPGKP